MRTIEMGFIRLGYKPEVTAEGSYQRISPHRAEIIGEQLRLMCVECTNGRGLDEGTLEQGGRIVVFGCNKERPGGCAIIDAAAASPTTCSEFSVNPVDVAVLGLYGTKVSVSHRK